MLGVFDSGFGGLTILRKFQELLPQYDYMFLGDNARAPYGSRSFETVYAYTLQAVRRLFDMGCPLVILACNTASAKALRTIQQHDLPSIDPSNRVLGIIRPTSEVINNFTKTKHVGILGTQGTINSKSYILEIQKLYPNIRVFQQPCPMLAALVENGEISNPGTDYFVKKYFDSLMSQSPDIDAVVLGCTHYPLLMDSFLRVAAADRSVSFVQQDEIVARSLADYLSRHPEMESRLSKGGRTIYYTTDTPEGFDNTAEIFLGRRIKSERIEL
ncbi:MAG: glutamate racemase [Bacteroidales bacterium]|nr:glutamate racemase [Bacteroidales bacterium]